eukprot:447766-Rhodomonas_salina.2
MQTGSKEHNHRNLKQFCTVLKMPKSSWSAHNEIGRLLLMTMCEDHRKRMERTHGCQVDYEWELKSQGLECCPADRVLSEGCLLTSNASDFQQSAPATAQPVGSFLVIDRKCSGEMMRRPMPSFRKLTGRLAWQVFRQDSR